MRERRIRYENTFKSAEIFWKQYELEMKKQIEIIEKNESNKRRDGLGKCEATAYNKLHKANYEFEDGWNLSDKISDKVVKIIESVIPKKNHTLEVKCTHMNV